MPFPHASHPSAAGRVPVLTLTDTQFCASYSLLVTWGILCQFAPIVKGLSRSDFDKLFPSYAFTSIIAPMKMGSSVPQSTIR